MQPEPFAEIDSSEELIVRLDQAPKELTIEQLSDRICVPTLAIIDSLQLLRNHAFAVALYEGLREEWGGVLLADGEEIPLPLAGALFEQDGDDDHGVLHYLSLGARLGPVDPTFWRLPKMQFYVTWGGLSGPLLRGIATTSGSRRMECVAVHDETASTTALAELERAIEKLENSMLEAAEQTTRHRAHLGVLVNAGMVVEQAQRARGAQERDPEEKELQLALLHRIGHQLDQLQARILDHLINNRPARDAARDLLALFQRNNSKHAELQAVIEAILEHPERTPSHTRDRLLLLLERAFAALAASPQAERFVELHLCDLLELACASVPDEFRDEWAELEDHDVAEIAREGWAKAFEDARQSLLIRGQPRSLLSSLVKGGSTVGRMGAVIAAGLSDHTIGAFLTALYRARGSRVAAAKAISGALLRYIAFHCVQHNSRAQRAFPPPGATKVQVLMASKRASYHRVVKILGDTKLGPEERGKRLAELRLDKGFMRTPRAIGFLVAINALSLFLVVNDEKSAVPVKVLGVLAGAGAIGTSILKYQELQYVRRTLLDESDVLEAKWALQRTAGAIVAGLAFAWSLSILVDDHHKKKGKTVIALDIFGAAGSGSVLMSSVATLWNWTRLATVLGVAGNLIGLAVLVASIIYVITSRGPKQLLEAYLEYLEKPLPGDGDQSFVTKVSADILFSLRQTLDEAEEALAPFKARIGSSEDDPTSGVPTYWKAKHLGFSQNEISALFDVDPVAVAPLFSSPDATVDQ